MLIVNEVGYEVRLEVALDEASVGRLADSTCQKGHDQIINIKTNLCIRRVALVNVYDQL